MNMELPNTIMNIPLWEWEYFRKERIIKGKEKRSSSKLLRMHGTISNVTYYLYRKLIAAKFKFIMRCKIKELMPVIHILIILILMLSG